MNKAERIAVEEVSEEEWGRMVAQAKDLSAKANRILLVNPENPLSEDKAVSLSCGHILRNALTYLRGHTPLSAKSGGRAKSEYDLSMRGIAYLKRYFALLDTYPDFKEAELRSGQGAISPDGCTTCAELLDHYEKVLKKRQY